MHYVSHLFFSVRHILNVTREIDNFFPGSFNYLNVRVYDDDKTDLLKHWDNTYKYITKAEYVDLALIYNIIISMSCLTHDLFFQTRRL